MLSKPPGKSLKVLLTFIVELPTVYCKTSKDKVFRGSCPLKCIGVQSIWAV